jgi:hypothetical protein
VVPGCGTFFAYADWAAPGCNNVFFAPINDPTSYQTDTALNRKGAAYPNDLNYGFGGTYIVDPLATKFGLYYTHVDQPTPVGSTIKTLRAGNTLFIPGNPDGLNPAYSVSYTSAFDTATFNMLSAPAAIITSCVPDITAWAAN